jgi:hypothetical protein
MPQIQDTQGSTHRRWRELRAQGKRSSVLPPLGSALDEYERNLREIVQSGRIQAVRVVLMTQPVLWRAGLTDREEALLWMGGVGDFQSRAGALYYEPEALERGMDEYNERLRKVCRDMAVECIDLSTLIPKTTEYFADDCHFTDKAQILLADIVASALLESRGGAGLGAPPSSVAKQK